MDVNLIVPPEQLPLKLAEAATLPKVPLTDYDINWLQVIGEGWAAPLKGFMREGALVQQLWFNSMLVDEHNHTGMGGYLDKHTNWMQARGGARDRAALGVRVRVGAVPYIIPYLDVLRTASP